MQDPICGMEVENEDFALEYEGKKYLFCSMGCLEKFKETHADYVQKHTYDLVIIGGGPAGLTAAVYSSVLKLDTVLLTKDIGGQAVDSAKVKNYMGFDFITGQDLIDRFRSQFLNEHYLDHYIDEVTKIEPAGEFFEVLTKERRKVRSRAVVIATGMTRRKLGIPGEERLQRQGIFYSLVHDVSRFQGMKVVIVGGGNSGIQTANELKELKGDVTLVSKGSLIGDPSDVDRLRKSEHVEIVEDHDVVEILGDEKVKGVIIQSRKDQKRREIPCDGVFIQVGFMPNTDMCRGLLDLNERGEIVTGPDCSTSREGIYACGDVTNSFGKRIVIASGEGAKAALRAREYLFSP
jgi:alkyl hydroperoxide reductase subunit F